MADRASDVAHDLKTPLNIITLNSELLRMRLAESGDSKAKGYCKAIELEARRIGVIIDSFFSLFKWTGEDSAPGSELAIALGCEQAEVTGELGFGGDAAAALGRMIRASFPSIFKPNTVETSCEAENGMFRFTARGLEAEDVEIGKALKFYYTDSSGVPTVELATARILAEMAGGSLDFDISTTPMTLTLEIPLQKADG